RIVVSTHSTGKGGWRAAGREGAGRGGPGGAVEPSYDAGVRSPMRISAEVSAAVADGRPVVALEATVFSRLGLPAPAEADARPAGSAASTGTGGGRATRVPTSSPSLAIRW